MTGTAQADRRVDPQELRLFPLHRRPRHGGLVRGTSIGHTAASLTETAGFDRKRSNSRRSRDDGIDRSIGDRRNNATVRAGAGKAPTRPRGRATPSRRAAAAARGCRPALARRGPRLGGPGRPRDRRARRRFGGLHRARAATWRGGLSRARRVRRLRGGRRVRRRIVAGRGEREQRRLSTNEAPINGRAPKASLPPGSRRPAAARSCVRPRDIDRGAEPGGPSCGGDRRGNGGRAEGGSAAGSRRSASAAELTEEGLRGLRRRAAGVAGLGVRGVRGVRGREDERRDGNEEDEEDEEDEDETVSASLRAFDDVLPAAGGRGRPAGGRAPAANRRASTRDDSSKKNAGGGGEARAPRGPGASRLAEVRGRGAGVGGARRRCEGRRRARRRACAFGTEPFVPAGARSAAPTSRRRR